jgi:sterol desaturase/sphingolipid hydroxylase (fatty acid hydroxylase superfamily)
LGVDAQIAEPSPLTAELRTFVRHPSPRFISAVLIVVVGLRVLEGGWGWPDAVVAAAILGFEPFTEWLIHVFVLHAKPKRILGRTVDLYVARKHRRHHADPRDVDLVFVPLQVVGPGLVVVVAGVLLLAPDRTLGLTGLVTGVAMLLLYEWTHFLIHTRYRPRGRYYRSIHRAHRLHHFRNEHYWFGVTINVADHMLGTFPAKDEVEASPTARTLGVEETVTAAG